MNDGDGDGRGDDSGRSGGVNKVEALLICVKYSFITSSDGPDL